MEIVFTHKSSILCYVSFAFIMSHFWQE